MVHSRRGRVASRLLVPAADADDVNSEGDGIVESFSPPCSKLGGKALDNKLHGARSCDDGPTSKLWGRGMDASFSFLLSSPFVIVIR